MCHVEVTLDSCCSLGTSQEPRRGTTASTKEALNHHLGLVRANRGAEVAGTQLDKSCGTNDPTDKRPEPERDRALL